jgi:dCTP diphosphatase
MRALLLRLAQAKAHDGLRERSAGIGAFDWSGGCHGIWNRTMHRRIGSTRIVKAGSVPNHVITLNLAPEQFRRHGRAMKSMTDAKTTVGELRERVLAFAREREWEQFHSPKNLSMALAAEAGELMEHFLWTESKDSAAPLASAPKREKIEDELADVVIYALEFANIGGIDLAQAIEAKLAKNAAKYPVEKARGSAKKYNEL